MVAVTPAENPIKDAENSIRKPGEDKKKKRKRGKKPKKSNNQQGSTSIPTIQHSPPTSSLPTSATLAPRTYLVKKKAVKKSACSSNQNSPVLRARQPIIGPHAPDHSKLNLDERVSGEPS